MVLAADPATEAETTTALAALMEQRCLVAAAIDRSSATRLELLDQPGTESEIAALDGRTERAARLLERIDARYAELIGLRRRLQGQAHEAACRVAIQCYLGQLRDHAFHLGRSEAALAKMAHAQQEASRFGVALLYPLDFWGMEGARVAIIADEIEARLLGTLKTKD